MTNTKLSVLGDKFLINGKLTYSEIEGSKKEVHGLLMNARFIQGIFDDKSGRGRYARFGNEYFDADENTDKLIAELPNWYSYGLRAFTVGFQGGGACFTINNSTVENNPFGADGKSIDPAYKERMDRLIKAADKLGMVVIVSFFYGAQAKRIKDDDSIINAVKTASNFLRDQGYTNTIIEIANEHNVGEYKVHPILHKPEGVALLIEIAKRESGGMLVGCSGAGGGYFKKEICEASSVILIHGNGCSRQNYYNMIKSIKEYGLNRPIVCNEDSQAIGQLEVAFKTSTSWGYYNNMTKQEPPTNWSIMEGEDKYFAYRMAEYLGIKIPNMSIDEQYYLHGFEPNMIYEGKRWIRVGSLYPETINYVDFYRNDELVYTSYDEPFSLYFSSNWLQGGWTVKPDEKEWKAVIHLRDGRIIEKKHTF